MDFKEIVKNFKTEQIRYLFNDKFFFVPKNQRPYSWSEERWKELLEDILDILESRSKEKSENYEEYHFFGPMFFIGESGKLEILDGQQRIATLTIIFQVIWDLLDEINEKHKLSRDGIEAFAEVSLCLGVERDKRFFYRTILGDQCNKMFEYLLSKRTKPLDKTKDIRNRASDKSESDLNKCYVFFLESILSNYAKRKNLRFNGLIDIDTITSSDGFDKYLKNLAKSILEGLYVLESFVPSKEVSYEMFETLNQRGEKLLTADLFKNFLFSKFVNEVGEEKLNNFWGDLIDITGERQLSVFLRHYWLSNYEFVREKKLFVAIRKKLEELESSETVFETFSSQLLKEAKIYSAFSDSKNKLWQNQGDIPSLLEEINYLSFIQQKPLLLAAYISTFKDDPKIFEKLILFFRNFAVRRYIMSKRNANEFEEKYSAMAREIRAGSMSVQNIISFFEKESVSYEMIKELIEYGLELKDKGAKYVLGKVNDSISTTELIKCWENNPTLEHVVPKNPNFEWKSLLSSKGIRHEKIVNRLGNLTLLSKKENAELGNINYKEKREKYLSLGLPLNNLTFNSIKDFGLDEAKQREALILDIIVKNKIWGE